MLWMISGKFGGKFESKKKETKLLYWFIPQLQFQYQFFTLNLENSDRQKSWGVDRDTSCVIDFELGGICRCFN